MHSFLVISANIVINRILLKLNSLDYIFVANSLSNCNQYSFLM